MAHAGVGTTSGEGRRARVVFSSEEAMLAGASDPEPLGGDDGKSGASLARVHVDGEPHVLKRTTLSQDWTMRLTGDTVFRPRLVWQRGIMDDSPAGIDHAVVAMAFEDDPDVGPRLSILMRDVGPWLVPEGDEPVTLDQHRRFLAHMAALAARHWGFADGDGDLCATPARVLFFSRQQVDREVARADHSPVLDVAAEGWQLLPERAPDLAGVVLPFHDDPRPLAAALDATPQTFLHGDWKMGNLGCGPDGRTILLDWAYPGPGPATLELAWYLALNAARLPESKEASIDAYRAALADEGVDTDRWWDRQLGLSLIAIMAMFGWEKAVGGGDELAWWAERVDRERRWLE